ncbi:MAG: radical SAM protein [Halarcobacter sp.]
MRIKNHIKVLKGKNRFAVYNLKNGTCEPATKIEIELLRLISIRKTLTPKKANIKNLWFHLSSMRKKGWLEAGKAQVYLLDLEIKKIDNSNNKTFERVWIEPTLSCNFSCNHCYAMSNNKVNRDNELDENQWINILQKVLVYDIKYITFIGGEPMIRKDLIKSLVIYIKENSPNIKVGIFSNLYNIIDADIQFIIEHNLGVSTSLYGIEANEHDKMTNKVGSWVRTVEVIKKLTKNNINVFVGYFKNNKEITNLTIKSFLNSLGVTSFDIQNHHNVGRAIQKAPIKVSKDNILPLKMSFNPNTISKYSSEHNCFSNHISISSNGDVMGCIMMRKPEYGNLLSDSLDKILSSKNYIQLSKLTKDKIEGCSECEFRYGCFDCRAGAMSDSNNLFKKPDCGYDPRLVLSFEND